MPNIPTYLLRHPDIVLQLSPPKHSPIENRFTNIASFLPQVNMISDFILVRNTTLASFQMLSLMAGSHLTTVPKTADFSN